MLLSAVRRRRRQRRVYSPIVLHCYRIFALRESDSLFRKSILLLNSGLPLASLPKVCHRLGKPDIVVVVVPGLDEYPVAGLDIGCQLVAMGVGSLLTKILDLLWIF